MLLLPAKPWLAGMQILPEERRDIPHHLLDILGPSQEFSAGDFFEAGRAATQAILQVSSITAYSLELCAVPCECFRGCVLPYSVAMCPSWLAGRASTSAGSCMDGPPPPAQTMLWQPQPRQCLTRWVHTV